eukprot:336111-Pleurochrysis_carterae.AAC.1
MISARRLISQKLTSGRCSPSPTQETKAPHLFERESNRIVWEELRLAATAERRRQKRQGMAST